jgi:hypothetical protein
VRQHVEQQEDEDADGDRVERGPQARCGVTDPAERQTEEDRAAGDRREDEEPSG